MASVPLIPNASFWSETRLAYGLLPVITLLERGGHSSDRLLNQAGIDKFGLMDPAYTISIHQELSFLRNAMRHLPPTASLALARLYRLQGFSVLGLAMQSSQTPMQLIGLILKYPQLAWGVFDCEIHLTPQDLQATLIAPPMLGAAEGFLAERDMACALVVIETALEHPFEFRAVSFRHACAGDPEEYQQFFRCPVQFEAPSNRMIVSRRAADLRMPNANPVMLAFYEAQCERMSRDMQTPFQFSEAVRSRLRRGNPIPDLPTLAATMFLTPRTLQRRLAAEGTSFSALLQSTREERAKQLLLETARPMESIATELGFGDAVAFSHAFKSWTGRSPQRVRELRSTACA